MRKLFAGVLLAAMLASLPGLALADAAGSAKGVNPAAEAEREGTTQTLVVGADIFIGDLVETGPKGQVQILFADNTELVVGPRSSLRIEDYLIRNDGSAGRLAVNMLAGTFRFATGESAKNRYQIDTPTGTIGVRGTGFDVFVDLDGTTRILMYHGAVRFCTLDNKCKDLSALCEIGQIDTADTTILGDSRPVTGSARKKLKHEFIYSENQSPLLRQFWMTHAYECLHNPPNAVAPPTIGDGEGDGLVVSEEPPPPDTPGTPTPPDPTPTPTSCNLRDCLIIQ